MSSIDAHRHPRLAAAVDAFQNGRPVLLLDDADRENEADIVAPAENLNQHTMARMIRNGSGIVCLCLDEASVDRLGLAPMVRNNHSHHCTGFTVSIEAMEGVKTGVSAADRVTTIQAALDSIEGTYRIISPGHVFPLRARADGVLERRGHTEGSVDLAVLSDMRPAAVLCELMNDDGSMAGNDDIQRYARMYDLPVLTIEEIAAYRSSRAGLCA